MSYLKFDSLNKIRFKNLDIEYNISDHIDQKVYKEIITDYQL